MILTHLTAASSALLGTASGPLFALLADGAAPGPAPSGGGGIAGMLGGPLPMMLVMFGIFYFLVIRPQQKKQRELQDWLQSIEVGTEVVTTGGLWGKVKGITPGNPYVTLELQEKVRVRVLRAHIAGKAPAITQTPAPAQVEEKSA